MQMFITHFLAVWVGFGMLLGCLKINELFRIFDDSSIFGLLIYLSIASVATGLVAWALL